MDKPLQQKKSDYEAGWQVVAAKAVPQLEPQVGPHGGLTGNEAQPLNAELPEFLRGGQRSNVGNPKGAKNE